jgi:hypothetical protein
MRSVPRTRDLNGKYIPGSRSHYYVLEPEKDVRFRDQEFYSRDKQVKAAEEGAKTLKSASEISDRQAERKGRGYESISIPLFVPLERNTRSTDLPQYPFRTINVDDIRIKNEQFFHGSFGEIKFTEGSIISTNKIKLLNGSTIETAKTWNEIEEFQMLEKSSIGYLKICIKITNHCLNQRDVICLLETSKTNPSPLHGYRMHIDSVVNPDCVIVSPEMVRKQKIAIPDEFHPEHLLVYPSLDESDVCKLINSRVNKTVCQFVNEKYEIHSELNPANPTALFNTILPKERNLFETRIPEKYYDQIESFAQELEQAMNPPIIPKTSLMVDNEEVEFDRQECSSINELCNVLETNINTKKRWRTELEKISVSYSDENRILLQRNIPFSFQSETTLFGFPVSESSKSCLYESEPVHFCCNSSNRYTATASEDGMIEIKALSRSEYYKEWHIDESEIKKTVGWNFVLPFRFIDTPLSKSFLSKNTQSARIRFSNIIGKPKFLLLRIAEIENQVKVSNIKDMNSAILTLDEDGYGYHNLQISNNGNTKSNRNISVGKDLPTLSFEYYTAQGELYSIVHTSGYISLTLYT